jgi:hypothetical protein
LTIIPAYDRHAMKNNNTFRSLLSVAVFLVLSLAILLAGIAFAAGNAVVSVTAPAGAVNPGEQFTIDIDIVPNNAIAGMQFNLSFDPSLVSADSIVEGDLLGQGGADTYFSPGQIDNVAGTITGVFGVIITPGQSMAAPGTLATITMTAAAAGGACPLTLSNVVVGDMNGQSVPVDLVDGSVSINRPPVLDAVGDRTVDEGATLTFTVSASDPDGGTLTYSASNLPSGASFEPATRTFSWTPDHSQAGTYNNVRFTVSDGSLEDSENITITVNNAFRVDVNGDGLTNVLDVISIAQHWNEQGASGWIEQDVNEDGVVNVLDVILIGQNWVG